MFPCKLCCAPSLLQSTVTLLSIVQQRGFCTALGMICYCCPPAWLPKVVGFVEYYRVHLGSENCCQSGTITEIILQSHLHQPMNTFWSGWNIVNS